MALHQAADVARLDTEKARRQVSSDFGRHVHDGDLDLLLGVGDSLILLLDQLRSAAHYGVQAVPGSRVAVVELGEAALVGLDGIADGHGRTLPRVEVLHSYGDRRVT